VASITAPAHAENQHLGLMRLEPGRVLEAFGRAKEKRSVDLEYFDSLGTWRSVIDSGSSVMFVMIAQFAGEYADVGHFAIRA
jgi:hypothetical protein